MLREQLVLWTCLCLVAGSACLPEEDDESTPNDRGPADTGVVDTGVPRTDTGTDVDLGDDGTPTNPDMGDFRIVYLTPINEYYQQWETYLREQQVIESATNWLNGTFALPRDVDVYLQECEVANAFYFPSESAIVMCYELLGSGVQAFVNAGYAENDASSGALQMWYWVFFHEVGHALVDLFDLPITGLEEDAVDQFSTLVTISAGVPEVSEWAAAYWAAVDDGATTRPELADEHSLGWQRLYNILCWVYGSDPTGRAYLLDLVPDLAQRAERCPWEFQQMLDSWNELLGPWAL